MEQKSLRILITGAAGRIAYSLLNNLCSGHIFGYDVSIKLHLLDLKEMKWKLEGVLLELEDGAYPLLADVKITENLPDAFKDIDLVIFLGGRLR